MNRKRLLEKPWTETRRRAPKLTPIVAAALLMLSFLATSLVGQQTPTRLTLQEAIDLARQNNPTFLSTQNDEGAAAWQVREAYASFLPTVNTSIGGTWQQSGAQRFGTIVFDDQVTDWYFSFYNIGLGMTIDGSTIFGIPNARANKRSAAARVDAAEFNLEQTVALQYTNALRLQEVVAVSQRQLDRARQNADIVATRVATGADAGTAGKQAEVDLGRAEVTLIQAERDLRQAKLLLAEQLGVPLEVDVELASEFEIFEPDFDLAELERLALGEHPSLRSFRAQESASRAAARQTSTGQYIPSLRLSANFSGQAQEALNRGFVLNQAASRASSRIGNCEFENALSQGGIPGFSVEDCSQLRMTAQDSINALASNNVFPFNFTEIPARVSAVFSLPIFNGFTRERALAQANAAADDAEHNRRAEELRLRTAVTNMYDNVVSAQRVVELEERNRAVAEEQLLLQQRRYALGAAAILELLDAQTAVTTADQAYLNAVYDFQFSLIALEAAVGRPLRERS